MLGTARLGTSRLGTERRRELRSGGVAHTDTCVALFSRTLLSRKPSETQLLYRSRVFKGFLDITVLGNDVKQLKLYGRWPIREARLQTIENTRPIHKIEHS